MMDGRIGMEIVYGKLPYFFLLRMRNKHDPFQTGIGIV